MSSYRKTMAEAVREVREAQMVSDISGISITALKKEARKFNIQVTKVSPGGNIFGGEYEVTFSGAEKDLIAYAKEHLGFDDKPGNFMQLKKHLNMSYNDIEEISDKLKLKVLARNIKKLKDKFLKKTIPGTGAMFAQKEEVELEEKFTLYALKDFIDRSAPGGKRKKGDRVGGPMTYTQAVSKAKQMNVGSSLPGGDKKVEVRPMKEEVEIDEGRMKDIFTADQEGKSADEIAKIMKLPLKTVKSILGEASIKPYVSMQRDQGTGKMNYVVLDKDEKEAFKSTNQIVAQDYLKKNYNKLREENLDEFTLDQLNTLKKSYSGLKGMRIAPDKAIALSKHLDKLDLLSLRQLNKEKIPFISTLARNKIYKKTGKFEEVELENESSFK